jgi:hypothetical protein
MQLVQTLQSDLLKLSCLLSATFAVIFEHEAHSIALLQHPNASGLQGSRVNKHIFAAFVRLDESEALGCVEEFHGTIRHDLAPFRTMTAE